MQMHGSEPQGGFLSNQGRSDYNIDDILDGNANLPALNQESNVYNQQEGYQPGLCFIYYESSTAGAQRT